MNKAILLKSILAATAIFTAIYLASTGLMTGRKEGRPVEDEKITAEADFTSVIQNFHHIESQLNEVGWELKAKTAKISEKTATLETIEMKFYTSGEEVVRVTGDDGVIDMETKNIRVKGNVQASYNEQYEVFTEEVFWDEQNQRLEVPTSIRIVGPEGEIKGNSLVAEPSKKIFIVEGNVVVDLTGGEGLVTYPSGENS